MPCRRCGADVASGLLLCGACSVLAAPVCDACGIPGLPGARFCDQCGARLPSPLAPQASTRLPGRRAEQQDVRTAGRRQLTVLFSDLVNSTLLSRELDPEDLREVLSDYQIICTKSIERYGGFVAQYLGDGILAYFGQPLAHEDDAERAVRAGLKLIQRIEELGHRLGREKNIKVNIRVGIATGLVFVGAVPGLKAAMDNNAVGEAPNLAAKLQSLAQPNTIVVCDQTKQLAAAHFAYRDLGPQTIKGFGNAVPAWQVVGEQLSSRFEARQSPALPLIGREEEIATLLTRWDATRQGQGQLVLIQGKAGIGKSRLIAEMRQRLPQEANAPPQILTFQCSQLHSNTPFYAITRQFEQQATIHTSDNAQLRHDKLAQLLGHSPLNRTNRDLILHLLGAGVGDGSSELPQDARRRTLDALNDWLSALAETNPVLLVFEDVQWLDPTSRAFIEGIAGWIRDAAVLLVASLRSDAFDADGVRTSHDIMSAEWLKLPYATTLTLDELSNRQSRQIVLSLAPGTLLSSGTIDAVIDKAEGIPLFIEELTKGAVASLSIRLPSPISQSSALPSTITGSLAARLDAVGAAKEVAQHAAVIGREFSFEMLSRLLNHPGNKLRTAIDVLLRAELINRTDPAALGSTYAFKHGLIRDAAYQSMPRRLRATVHLQIAAALDQPQQAIDLSAHAVIAQHYSLGNAHSEAVENWRRAAEIAFARSAHAEAANLLQRALADVRELPDDDRARQEFNLTMKLAAALRSVHGYGAQEVEERYLQALRLCDKCGAVDERQYVEWGLMQCNLVRGNLGGAKRFAAVMLRNASENPGRPVADAYLGDGMVKLNFGDFEGSRVSLERALDFATREPETPHLLTHGQSPRIFARSYLAQALWLLGYPDQARLHIEENLANARSMAKRDPAQTHTYVNALAFSLRVYQSRREPDHVLSNAEELIEISRAKQYAYYEALGTIYHGWARATIHAGATGLTQIGDALLGLERTGAVLALRGCRLYLAELYQRIGMNEEARNALDAASSRAAWGTRVWDAELHRVRGMILASAQQSELMAAEQEFRRSLEIASRQKAASLQLRAAVCYARFLLGLNREQEALMFLQPAMEGVHEGRDSIDFAEASSILGRLLLTSPQAARAAAHT
ncbi:AAA family ATPase [Leptospira interrogans]